MIQNEWFTFCKVLSISSIRKQLEIVQFGQHAYYQLPISSTKEPESPRLEVIALEKTNWNTYEPQLSSYLRMEELLISIFLTKKKNNNQILNTQQSYFFFFLYTIPVLILWTLLPSKTLSRFFS